MERTVIVTGGTRKDVSAMGALALNIREMAPDLADEMIIFHDGIKHGEQEIINKIFPTKFIKYKFPLSFWDKRKNSSLRYFSQMVFCKYECFRLLKDYDRVIWTDYDIVIKKDLKELTEENIGLQIVEDNEPLRHMLFEDLSEVSLQEFDLEKKGVATPLFVLTKEIGDYQKYYEWCHQATLKYAPYIYLPEQCIISFMVQKFQIDYKDLPARKYALHPRDDDGNSSIVHGYGRPKFWEGLRNEQWEKYYAEWLELGGSPYKKPLKEKMILLKERIFHK